MKIQFYLRFYTEVGQSLWISSNEEVTGNLDDSNLPMIYLNNEFWQARMELTLKAKQTFTYKYFLKNKDGEIIREWGDDRVIESPGKGIDELILVDTWNHAGEF